jgi:hypothetical protein
MDFMDLISPATSGGQAGPMGMPGADGDPLAKLKELLQQSLGSSQPAGVSPDQAMQPTASSLPLSDATDFSGSRRAPVSVPLPAPRPEQAPQPSPVAPAGMPQAPAALMPQGNDLRSLIAPPTMQSRMKNAMASLGGGLSSVEGNTAGGAFARAMGGGIKAGNASDSADFDQSIKALRAVQEAKQFGTTEQYKQALTNYYKVLTDQKNQQATVQSAVRAAGNAAKPASAVAAAPKKAGKPGEISFNGDGTQTSPYEPQSKDDYDQIEPGSYYTVNGQLRRKK